MFVKDKINRAIKNLKDRKEEKKKVRTERFMKSIFGDILRGITGNGK